MVVIIMLAHEHMWFSCSAWYSTTLTTTQTNTTKNLHYILLMFIPYTMKISLKKTFVVFVVFRHPQKFFQPTFLNMALFKYGFKRMQEEDKVVFPDSRGELTG